MSDQGAILDTTEAQLARERASDDERLAGYAGW